MVWPIFMVRSSPLSEPPRAAASEILAAEGRGDDDSLKFCFSLISRLGGKCKAGGACYQNDFYVHGGSISLEIDVII